MPFTRRTRATVRALILGVACAAGVAPLAAQSTPSAWSRAGTEGEARFPGFRFADGGRLDTLRVHYTTLGRPVRDAAGVVTNAVLVLHGTGGSGRGFLNNGFAGELFGPGQLLDSATYYIILPDGIGHGRSSKPSDGLRARFPRYGYRDMVTAQERLLREQLGVTRLRLIIGTSMGCMHAFTWGWMYPGVADGMVPLACLPTQIAGRNRMLRTMAMDFIRTDPEWQGGEYTTQPRGLRAALGILFVMSSAPLVQQAQAPTQGGADSVIRAFLDARARTTDANDFLYQLDASSDYDPSPHLARIATPILHINSQDDLINPPELGIAERLDAQLPRARFINLPIGPATRGHGTHSVPVLWRDALRDFMATLPPR
ncbi:MAG: alpha/beta fold hydrolase [Gemmatimonadaceae bacterium]|nr:alpha/beta fold hydrolase [Gemmatimonadaceae bacterium]